MVDKIKLTGVATKHKIESAYTVLYWLCTGAAVAKLALQPKVHTSLGLLPVWQVIAGVLGAGLIYGLFQLIDGDK